VQVILKPNQVPIKAWIDGVTVEEEALKQLDNIAKLPFIHSHIAVQPDVHWGLGATIGSVIPTTGAIIPAAVGVDLNCGMMAQRTTLHANDLPDSLSELRTLIEAAIPHGRTNDGRDGDRGAWGTVNEDILLKFQGLGKYQNSAFDAGGSIAHNLQRIAEKYPKITRAVKRAPHHIGTLGTGNHFVEVCLDEEDRVWVMLHSGSRGIGNAIGSYFIELARQDMRKWFINLPDIDLAYLPEGTDHFNDYMHALRTAARFASMNRYVMMDAALGALRKAVPKPFEMDGVATNCHHNYVHEEKHFGKKVFVTRKGAVKITSEQLGIIPGSMGAKSFIVKAIEGKAHADAFCSCSHGAGRSMSRNQAKKIFTLDDHAKATEGIECRKDADVIDETPMAYKPIEDVMAAQADHVEIVHTLRQVVVVKG
jgi:tRNA-splicing ligase RtcB